MIIILYCNYKILNAESASIFDIVIIIYIYKLYKTDRVN